MFHVLNVSLCFQQQCNFMSQCLGSKTWNISTLPMLVYCVKQAGLSGTLSSMKRTIYFQIQMSDRWLVSRFCWIHISLTSDLHCFCSVCWLYLGSCSSNIVIFNKFLVSFFQFRTAISSSLDNYSSIFNIVTFINQMPVKYLKWSSTTRDLLWFWSTMQSTFTFFPFFVLSRALHITSINHKPITILLIFL